jgi:amino acid transporter
MQRSQLFATCLYAIPFICLGNMAGNAISFGLNIMIASGIDTPSNGAVRAIAVGVATFACSLHMVSRRWGIALNNFFGSVKTAILLMLIIVGIVSFAGALPEKTEPTAEDNFGKYGGFGLAETSSYGYASSFLSVIFAYGGFNQANYVRTSSSLYHLC